ncbi:MULTISPECIES: DUF4132 domain-containing protein [unclassified Streptosporangium]|uniref:DUF4132 domain-containing protein n=1 Tax=unclassified Streptosporangium TaxID=2632669 RepID=UPI002E2E04FA|nr:MULTISPECIES: DUF4132 domain-containing protein [unclassified Streptosporangium]
MAILDELPPAQRAWLDCLDEATFDVFERLDAVFDPAEHAPWDVKLADTPMGRLAKEFGGAEWHALGLWGQLRLHISLGKGDYHRALTSVFTPVLRRDPRWTPADIELLWRVAVTPLAGDRQIADLYRLPLAATRRLPVAGREPYVTFLRQVKDHLAELPWVATDSVKRVIDNLLADHAGDPAVAARDLINELDPFAVLLREEYAARFGAPEVLPLLRHWTTATNPRPNAAWLDQATALLTPDAVTLVRDALSRIPGYRERVEPHPYRTVVTYFHEHTAVLVRGMVWTCELVDEPWVTGLLGDVAVATGTGVGGSGPNSRNERTTNAALGVLARRGGLDAVTQLARVQAKVRRKSILALAARTLDGVAEQTGLSPEQLLDRTVPFFGLEPDGTRTEHGLRLSADGVIAFVDDGGKVRKTIPKTVRSAHGELLAELKATAKELRKTLPAERFRVERALATERIWHWRDICAYYLDHPVTGRYGRALIWEISQDFAGLPVRTADGWELTDPRGRSVRPLPDTPVKLWHPISATVDEVRAWRDHVLTIGLRQPFKQAFREVYLLTPAEEGTGDHSRRFADHFLRYGQAKALLTERGWTGLSLGHWWAEGGYDRAEAVKELPGLTAHWDFHLDEASGERDGYGTASVCVSGDIHFTDEHGHRVSLAEVPPRVLSEALRDADLAVGVTSTGLAPDGHDDYWHSYNVGDLTETAQVRRDALTRLIPRLAIADRLELTDRFLRVRGDLRTYRIHLGSGNILMEPNDAYLCVVPGGAVDRVFLPFEEDGGMLSVILSKAFLLASDTTITDPSITHQLR